jgi:hypothetical protein
MARETNKKIREKLVRLSVAAAAGKNGNYSNWMKTLKRAAEWSALRCCSFEYLQIVSHKSDDDGQMEKVFGRNFSSLCG